jgi:hypothetical protein
MGEMRNAYSILVIPIERSSRYTDNIKMDFREMGCNNDE